MSLQYKKNLHAVLGVSESAGPEELRKAYLALAVKYHPDRNPGDRKAEEHFKDISQAYAVLSDPTARARYERLRRSRRESAASTGGKPTSSSSRRAHRQGGAAQSGRNTGEQTQDASGASAKSASGNKKDSDTRKKYTSSGSERASGAQESPRSERPDETTSGHESQTQGKESPDNDFDEILSGFFKTDKGKDTLRDLESELGKAGIRFKVDDFADWLKKKRKPVDSSNTASADKTKPLWERIMSSLPGATARARKRAERFEINYQLSLSPQAAAAGTTVEISYQRDDRTQHLKVRIPAGTKNGDRLRLSGQGRLKPDQKSRGDLILTILVGQGQSVSDLWN